MVFLMDIKCLEELRENEEGIEYETQILENKLEFKTC
jgi:hypothetical protein